MQSRATAVLGFCCLLAVTFMAEVRSSQGRIEKPQCCDSLDWLGPLSPTNRHKFEVCRRRLGTHRIVVIAGDC